MCVTTPSVPLAPEVAISALRRAGYGARPDEVGHVAREFPAWVEAQLSPREDEDQAVHERLAKLTLRVHYATNPKWPAVDETSRK